MVRRQIFGNHNLFFARGRAVVHLVAPLPEAHHERPQEPKPTVSTQSYLSQEQLAALRSDPANANETAQGRAERLASLGRLAAGVAHEINNPLAYMAVNLDLALDELAALEAQTRAPSREGAASLGPKLSVVLQALGDVREGVRRVGTVVEDLKHLLVAEQGEMPTVDARIALDAAIAEVRSSLPEGTRLVKMYGDAPPVRGSEPWLTKVFAHVLHNAAQALAETQNEREVRVTVRRDQERRVEIMVVDTGIGIAPEVFGRIFDPFFTTKHFGKNRGLGLAICNAIVSSLGGTIAVHSELGSGTRVQILLPCGSG